MRLFNDIQRKLILGFCLILLVVSCKKKENKPLDDEKNKTESTVESKVEDEPNIFVVKTTFPSKDSLLISADIYEVNGKKPTILLCHQAGFSRGEYKDIALKLNKLGYSCMSIDQRSGNEANGVKNETAQRAKEKGMSTSYLDAKQDIEEAIDYLYNMNENKRILIVGSSYSASLVLLIGKGNPKIKAIASFSPGEYLKGVSMKDNMQGYVRPIFVTSSKKEIKQVEDLNIVMVDGFKFHFKPPFDGIHGARALWESTENNDKYWEAFEAFLGMIANAPDPENKSTKEENSKTLS